MIPITDVKESLPVQEVLYFGDPVSIPKRWPAWLPRERKLLARGPGDGALWSGRLSRRLSTLQSPHQQWLPGSLPPLIYTVTRHAQDRSFGLYRLPEDRHHYQEAVCHRFLFVYLLVFY